MLRIGIDTGGTFTDFVVSDGEHTTIFKLPSTPANPEQAVLDGLEKILADRRDFVIQHGSTVATNALLERKGARTLLITNQGFEDVVEIGRQNRPGLYRLGPSKPRPLVEARFRIGVRERTLWNGTQLVNLEQKSLEWVKGKVSQLKPESIAVVLLYSYLNPENERRLQEALQEFGVPISLSHRILPEFREYERTSTTVINAYVRPNVSRYLSALNESESVRRGRLQIMQSNGGSISARVAGEEPVRTLFSGPAGGVVGAFEVARTAGFDHIITLDMGGTSTDVCLCDGQIRTTNEGEIDHLPVSIQTIQIHSVGAGGGSLAWVDEGGLLRVGPRSAGADPGPVCYGKGSEITVTDANLFLGRLHPDFFLGGEMQLLPERVPPALEQLGRQLESRTGRPWPPEEVADGILRIVNAQMEGALRLISLERGYDTRRLTLVAFGGAGGLHAGELARALLIPRILVPPNPGALSAQGISRADLVRDASLTVLLELGESPQLDALDDVFQSLEVHLNQQWEQEAGAVTEGVTFERSVDVRYKGQAYELNVPYGPSLVSDFHRRHEQVYGYSSEGMAVEAVNARVRSRYELPRNALMNYGYEGPEPPWDSLLQERPARFAGKEEHTRFYLRGRLKPGNRIAGPAVIAEYSATTLIPPGFEASVDEYLNLVIELRG